MTTITIPNKQFTFDPKEHLYKLDGKPMTGVTTVLGVIAKNALIQWAANEAVKFVRENQVSFSGDGFEGLIATSDELLEQARSAHRKKKEDAATKGTDVHAEIENLIKISIESLNGRLIVPIIPHSNGQIQKFVDWATQSNVRFLSCEEPIFSESMWLAGTPDFTCEIEGKKYVGDIKTYAKIWDRVPFLQMAAYRAMLEEMGHEDFAGSVVIRLGKDGTFEEKFSYAMEDDLAGFKAALTLYRVLETWKV